MTRKEKQAQTRSCLMKSAARVFARRGLQQASIDEVAEDAGFTKGAFYANFKNKEELFLAMLDERFAERIQQIEEVIAGEGTTTEKARRAGDDFAKVVAADPEWERLFFEFSAYAMRNEDFREELVTRYRAMRDRIAAALRARHDDFGIESALPLDQVAMMTCVMGNGFALEKLLEDDAVADDLYGNMLMVFFAGLAALKEASAATPV
ncbi:MAG: TetR/AcrR family transcriptional regulator [Thermoleophilaceae bacterium]